MKNNLPDNDFISSLKEQIFNFNKPTVGVLIGCKQLDALEGGSGYAE